MTTVNPDTLVPIDLTLAEISTLREALGHYAEAAQNAKIKLGELYPMSSPVILAMRASLKDLDDLDYKIRDAIKAVHERDV